MIVVDANLLLYAEIVGFPQHDRARKWWEETLGGSREVGLAAPALFAFLRISTNRRVLNPAMPVEESIGRVRRWLDQPHVDLVQPGPRHLDIAFELLQGVGTAGDLTTDAQLAALAIEYRAELYSNDSDFARFSGLKWVNPIA